MIQTETKTRYIDAIKDIRDVMLDKCPINLIEILGNECIPQLLRRWALRGDEVQGDIRADVQAILRGLDNVIEAISEHPCLYVMRGRALMAIGWHAVAIQDFERAVLATLDSADLYTFLAEAHLAQGSVTKSDPLACYASSAYNATKAIVHTARQGSPRPYLCRAQSDAHIMKTCKAYHAGTPMFDKKYRDIQCDLQEARGYTVDEGEQGRIDVIEENIDAMLGIDRI